MKTELTFPFYPQLVDKHSIFKFITSLIAQFEKFKKHPIFFRFLFPITLICFIFSFVIRLISKSFFKGIPLQ